jgi:ribonuclease HI
MVSFDEGGQIKGAEDHDKEFKKIFKEKMKTSKCFTTDGSKMENKSFVGFALIDISDGNSWKFRIAKIASTFTAETLAISETLETNEKIDSEKNFAIFSDSESVLNGISNTSTMNSISHITQMLKDKEKD